MCVCINQVRLILGKAVQRLGKSLQRRKCCGAILTSTKHWMSSVCLLGELRSCLDLSLAICLSENKAPNLTRSITIAIDHPTSPVPSPLPTSLNFFPHQPRKNNTPTISIWIPFNDAIAPILNHMLTDKCMLSLMTLHVTPLISTMDLGMTSHSSLPSGSIGRTFPTFTQSSLHLKAMFISHLTTTTSPKMCRQ